MPSLLERPGQRGYLSETDLALDDFGEPPTPGSLREQELRAEPAWVRPTLRALNTLVQLPENWNSYGARPIDPLLALTAFALLHDAAGSKDLPVPQVVPTSRGGVQLEWHTRGMDIEIEVKPAGRYFLFIEDPLHNQHREGPFSSDLGPLIEAVDELIRRG